jgi:hypothetical protein
MIISRRELLGGTTPADIIAPVLNIIGVPTTWTYAVSGFIDKAKQYFDFNSLEQKISQMFGARSPRFTKEQLLAYIYAIHHKYLNRDIKQADMEYWYPRMMFGYLTLADMENTIKSSDEYKNIRDKAWPQIRQAWIDILGHEPSDKNPEDNYYYMLLISGQQPSEAIRQALRDSAEYKSKHPIATGWLVPVAIAGATALILL